MNFEIFLLLILQSAGLYCAGKAADLAKAFTPKPVKS